MHKRTSFAALVSLLASAAATPIAHADIYTWVDASGTVNVSNVAPPDGTRVTNVVRTNAEAAEAARDAARVAQVQALTDRVRQLEQDVERARSQPALAMPYPPPVPPAAASYAPPVPQYVQYVEPPAPVGPYGCDPSWAGCALWWGAPAFYTPLVVIGGANRQHDHHRHAQSFRGGGHRAAAPASMHRSGRGRMR